jgi:hypothetical protein
MPDLDAIGNFVSQVGWPIAVAVGMFLIAAFLARLLLAQHAATVTDKNAQIAKAETRADRAEQRMELLTKAVESQTDAQRDMERTVLELLIRDPRRADPAKERSKRG